MNQHIFEIFKVATPRTRSLLMGTVQNYIKNEEFCKIVQSIDINDPANQQSTTIRNPRGPRRLPPTSIRAVCDKLGKFNEDLTLEPRIKKWLSMGF